MANPKDEPVSFINQLMNNPDSPTFQGSPADALRAINDEAKRLRDRQSKLDRGRVAVVRMLDAAAKS